MSSQQKCLRLFKVELLNTWTYYGDFIDISVLIKYSTAQSVRFVILYPYLVGKDTSHTS